MATYNGNGVFLSWDGFDISAYWTDQISAESSNETQDITAGSGQTHRQRADGLQDRTMSFMVVYDDTALSTYVQKLETGRRGVLIYGPEGNAAGKPKFEGSMILQQVTEPQPGIEKPMVTFELSFEQADAPTATIQGGEAF